MGGAVGLKGTDGKINEAIARGATPESPKKAIRFLSEITRTDLTFFTVSGKMGEEELKQAGYSGTCLYDPADPIQIRNTRQKKTPYRLARRYAMQIHTSSSSAVGWYCLGCYIHVSGQPSPFLVFQPASRSTQGCLPPHLNRLLISSRSGMVFLSWTERLWTLMKKHTTRRLNVRLFGYAKIPSTPIPCQSSKQVSVGDDRRAIDEIALFIVEMMRDDTLYLLGAGTTTKAIADRLGIDHTLLGVDAIYQRKMIGRDLSEDAIHTLLNSYDRVKIILSPIGAQGFILGRGNQQISRRVIERAGVDSLIVIASEAKLKNTKSLYIDTGDPELNKKIWRFCPGDLWIQNGNSISINQDTTLSGYELSG
jgi:predicted polyphosphate/ATP-dependent NAD kinase